MALKWEKIYKRETLFSRNKKEIAHLHISSDQKKLRFSNKTVQNLETETRNKNSKKRNKKKLDDKNT